MKHIFDPLREKLNHLFVAFLINGLVLIGLAVLIALNVVIMQFVIALITLVLAYSLFYAAYKIWTIKKLLK